MRFERLQRKGDAALSECPECGGAVRRLIQPPGIIFRGSGFYVTDNRRSSSSSRRSGSSRTTETSSETSDSKTAKDNKD